MARKDDGEWKMRDRPAIPTDPDVIDELERIANDQRATLAKTPPGRVRDAMARQLEAADRLNAIGRAKLAGKVVPDDDPEVMALFEQQMSAGMDTSMLMQADFTRQFHNVFPEPPQPSLEEFWEPQHHEKRLDKLGMRLEGFVTRVGPPKPIEMIEFDLDEIPKGPRPRRPRVDMDALINRASEFLAQRTRTIDDKMAEIDREMLEIFRSISTLLKLRRPGDAAQDIELARRLQEQFARAGELDRALYSRLYELMRGQHAELLPDVFRGPYYANWP